MRFITILNIKIYGNIMELKNIIEIAEDKIFADLCVRYYLETDETKKLEIFNQIQEMYKKLNNKQ